MSFIDNRYLLLFLGFIFFMSSCNNDGAPLFKKISSGQSGITFENTVTATDTFNAQTAAFIYNGAGTAIGDINNDGLMDIYFSGNMVSSRLYLNKGNMQFEDITESAGVSTKHWATGVSMVDINHDGYTDIYVGASAARDIPAEERKNVLFINNGDLTFTESAASYGIDDDSFTTHSSFLDYDRDGDLDLFLLNNSPVEFSRGEMGVMPTGALNESDPSGFDKLYRNNGDGTFTNVSEEAGILKVLGYGLGVGVNDFNADGWPDIYVSNDISPNDVLYINNQDGTFSNQASKWLRHTSFAGMGMDTGDFTNNGWPDILQSDMMPEELSGRKRMSGSTSYSGFTDMNNKGFFPHYNFNSLQMNQGVTNEGDVIFSEIARLAGTSHTNWSWTSLLVDLNNDGWKDILITNGYPKAMNDFDYLSDMHIAARTDSKEVYFERREKILDELHGYRLTNHIFRNNRDLTFTDVSDSWGMQSPGFTYGSAYADLDNDGRLDLIMNNINDPVWIYQNSGSQTDSSHYLTINFQGQGPNPGGVGAQVRLWTGEQQQFKYHSHYRGFMSSMDPRMHFGLGSATQVDSIRIHWPDGRNQLLKDIPADQVITIQQQEATHEGPSLKAPITPRTKKTFQEDPQAIAHIDQVASYVDYSVQPLLPYMISRQGPSLATADVDGDGLEDLYVGGTAGISGKLYLQQPDGQFTETPQPQPWQADSDQQDWGALFFDANGDDLPDLYVTSGSYYSSPVSLLLQDRLYINYGGGRFLKDTQALPQMLTSTEAVASTDFNNDGRQDLFVGGRLTPRNWPYPTRSYLLRNDGGRFTDVTAQLLPELAEDEGMITDAIWCDLTGDGIPELATVGQWMSIRVYQYNGQNFENITESMELPPLRGWWQSLEAADLNNDGRMDLVAGNLGLNHTYTASPDQPFGVVAGDFTGNRTTDIILTTQINGKEYPLYGLAKLGRDIYTIGIAYDSFESFSSATIEQVVGSQELEQALHYYADTFASVWLENKGQEGFIVHQLPNLAQISPIQDIVTTDVDGDGWQDLLVGGNLYETEPTAPRSDAGNGLWLKGDGTGEFTPIPPLTSGLLIPNDVRNLAWMSSRDGYSLIIGNNNDSLQVFRVQRE